MRTKRQKIAVWGIGVVALVGLSGCILGSAGKVADSGGERGDTAADAGADGGAGDAGAETGGPADTNSAKADVSDTGTQDTGVSGDTAPQDRDTGKPDTGGEICHNQGDDDGDGLYDCADPDCPNSVCPHLIFVTDDTWSGTFAADKNMPLAYADSLCAQAADDLPNRGAWKAVLSLNGFLTFGRKNASDHVDLSGRVVNMRGEVVASDPASFWSGEWGAKVDYTGGNDKLKERGRRVWTGSDAMGAATSETCRDWNKEEDFGGDTVIGAVADPYDASSALFDGTQGCDQEASLYCVSVP